MANEQDHKCCEDWEPQCGKINNFICLQAIRSGKPDIYDGIPFRFCPWCGKERPKGQVSAATVAAQEGAP